MARRRICPYCRQIVMGRCLKCSPVRDKDVRKEKERPRESAAKRGYDRHWRKSRIGFLKKHPFCVYCEEKGKRTLATVIDHFVPHRGDKKLFWDRSNWRPSCKTCHDLKTGLGE